MLSILKRLSWFEWFGTAAIVAVLLAGYGAYKEYRALQTSNVVISERNAVLAVEVEQEKQSALISDEVVSAYTFERELKIKEIDNIQHKSLNEYFETRDQQRPTKEVVSDGAVKSSTPIPVSTTTKTELAHVVEMVDLAAISVLASGMRDVYCRAYRDKSACSTIGTADSLPAK